MEGWLFIKTEIPFTQRYIAPSLVENGPVVLEKKKEMWKVYDNANDDNDDGQRTNCAEKLTWAFGSGELKQQQRYFDLKTLHFF